MKIRKRMDKHQPDERRAALESLSEEHRRFVGRVAAEHLVAQAFFRSVVEQGAPRGRLREGSSLAAVGSDSLGLSALPADFQQLLELADRHRRR